MLVSRSAFLTVFWVLTVSCSGTVVYDLNDRAKAEPPRPVQNSGWKEALGEAVLPLISDHDTEYAPGFSERSFQALEMGIAQDVVKRKIGDPLLTKTFADGRVYWYYSRHGKSSKSFLTRILIFRDDGRLEARLAEFYMD
jgi:hypothetical protein